MNINIIYDNIKWDCIYWVKIYLIGILDRLWFYIILKVIVKKIKRDKIVKLYMLVEVVLESCNFIFIFFCVGIIYCLVFII